MEPALGFEPRTYALQVRSSTPELSWLNIALKYCKIKKNQVKREKKLEIFQFYDRFLKYPKKENIKKEKKSWEILEKNAAGKLLSTSVKKC